MNYRMVLNSVGRLMWAEAALLSLPLAVSLYYKENLYHIYLIVMVILAFVGMLLNLPKPKKKEIYAREGFVIVALSWIVLSIFGALPFVLSGAIPSFVDALFETVSGFTTTGSTILRDIEALPKSTLFWRAFTHWIGGMGIIVFVLGFMPKKDIQSMHILRAEVPGPVVGKLVSKTTATAKILYIIYSVLTVGEIIALFCAGMPLFDSVTTAFATAGTGGFSVRNASIAAYNSLPIEIIITIFLILFGINFNLYFLLMLKQFKRVFKSEELWSYLGIIAVSTVLITANILPQIGSLGEALRQSGFQVASIITTAGFMTADFNLWPAFSQFVLMMLIFCGASTGSTGGGLKVGRVLILIKTCIREIKRAINPRKVKAIKLDGVVLEKETINATMVYFAIYMGVIAISTFIIAFDNFDILSVVTAVITCINNVGPGLASVGPAENFSEFSIVSKLVLSATMLIGRLEIFPMLILFLPATWKKGA